MREREIERKRGKLRGLREREGEIETCPVEACNIYPSCKGFLLFRSTGGGGSSRGTRVSQEARKGDDDEERALIMGVATLQLA